VRRRWGILALFGYAASIVAANWAISRFGFVPVGFGLVAPAGTYFAGAAFVARDTVQMSLGRWWVLIAIVVGAGISYGIAPSLAIASGTAFLVGELADFIVYTPIAERGRVVLAVALADTVGLLFDTFLFLWLAFHSEAHWQGTALGKEWMTLAALPIVFMLRRRYARPRGTERLVTV
jgi:queuosine precursor transporter